LIVKDRALFYADKGLMIVGAKARTMATASSSSCSTSRGSHAPSACGPRRMRSSSRAAPTFVELNGDAIAVSGDGRASVDLAAWGGRGRPALHARRGFLIEFAPKDVPLKDDVRTLGTLVGDVLREQCGDAFFQLVSASGTPRSPGPTMSCRRL